MINIYSFSIAFSILFFLVVIDLVRKNKLHEKYSLLWICFSVIILILSCSSIFIEKIAAALDIKYAPSVLFLLGFIYLLLYNLHLTTIVSGHTDKITKLAQELGLLKQQTEWEKLKDEDEH